MQNHSSISLNIKSGKIDFIENYLAENTNRQPMAADNVIYIREKRVLNINKYWYQEHFSGKAKKFFDEAFKALKSADYYDNSDAMTDYFDTSYYFGINVGKWDKPYEVTP